MAITKTIRIMREVGIKYGRSDFIGMEKEKWKSNISITHTMNGNVNIRFWYGNEKKQKELKKKKLEFYNYFNCRVDEDGIRFTYTKKELEIEYLKGGDSDTEGSGKVEAVMAKIQKLLALSESDNEHEAISASLMAQKLLAKYDIDIEQINGKGNEFQEIEEVCVDVSTGNKWKYQLAECVAKNYRCKCYYQGSRVIVFHGYRQDIMIARRVFAYLFAVCKRLATAYTKKRREESVGCVDGVFNSFCLGFIHGVNSELSKQCTELMLIIPQAVSDEFEAFSKSFGEKNISMSLNDGDAFGEGTVEGKRALNAQYVEDNSKFIE